MVDTTFRFCLRLKLCRSMKYQVSTQFYLRANFHRKLDLLKWPSWSRSRTLKWAPILVSWTSSWIGSWSVLENVFYIIFAMHLRSKCHRVWHDFLKFVSWTKESQTIYSHFECYFSSKDFVCVWWWEGGGSPEVVSEKDFPSYPIILLKILNILVLL